MGWRDVMPPRENRENRENDPLCKRHFPGFPDFPKANQRESPGNRRRHQVVAMLADRQAARYAVVTDDNDAAFPGCVVLAVGIRTDAGEVHACEIIVPREAYDGCKLLELIERHITQESR